MPNGQTRVSVKRHQEGGSCITATRKSQVAHHASAAGEDEGSMASKNFNEFMLWAAVTLSSSGQEKLQYPSMRVH